MNMHMPHRTLISRRAQSGFTLIELMVTLLAASIVGYTFFEALQAQKLTMLDSLDKTETLQNGRASLAILRRHVRMAGWGFRFRSSAETDQPSGVLPIGMCADQSTPKNASATGCDCDVVHDSACRGDHVRIVYIDPNTYARTTGTLDAAGGSVQVTAPTSTSTGTPIAIDDIVVIAGTCNALPFNSLMQVQNIVATTRTYSLVPYSDGSTTCSGGTFAQDAGFGRAIMLDFYLDATTDQYHPQLRMRRFDNATQTSNQVIAYDIDDFQIRYGVDTSDPNPDGFINASDWCDAPTDLSRCILPNMSNIPIMLGRIAAIQIAVVSRTRHSRASLKYDPVPAVIPLSPWNSTIRPRGDGYGRWVFRTTVALRNKQL